MPKCLAYNFKYNHGFLNTELEKACDIIISDLPDQSNVLKPSKRFLLNESYHSGGIYGQYSVYEYNGISFGVEEMEGNSVQVSLDYE
jgi:hypothetical protein